MRIHHRTRQLGAGTTNWLFYSEGEIIYLADTPFERLLDIQRQVGQCQTSFDQLVTG